MSRKKFIAGQQQTDAGGFDPNRLLDYLLQEMRLETDDDLCRVLNVEAPLLLKIRHGELPVGPSLLIRMNEVFDINVRDLRRLMGDRRNEYRLVDMQIKRKLLFDTDEAGMPNFVQWS
jgi:hypothetical protein